MGASNYNYNVVYQDPWADRNPRTKEDAVFDRLDATGVLHVVQRAMATEEDKVKTEQFLKDVQTFQHMYKAYRDTEHNKREMLLYWEEVLGVKIPTFAQIEESFLALRGRGVLQLDAKAVAQENQEDILRRAAEIREAREAAAFNEADAYTMPLEELEARARGW